MSLHAESIAGILQRYPGRDAAATSEPRGAPMALNSDRRRLLRNTALWAAAIPALPLAAADAKQGASAETIPPISIFNVKHYGATGLKADDARPAIQKAIDACGTAGGGIVYVPPGEYTSGTLYLRSHVRLHLEAGATLYASQDPKDFNADPIASKAALIFGEGLEDITIEGRGTVNGQAEYDWRPDDIQDVFLHRAKSYMQAHGKSIQRPFPKGYPERTVFPHLVWLGKSTNIRITGLSFIYSPSWTMTLYACERLNVDGVFIHTKVGEAVWADGIDMDGCKDVSISNSTIRTGDDCIIFISTENWGPALPCEDITVTNCRLSSSANAIKFSEGNIKGVHRVTIDNCVITDDSSGFAFLSADGGDVSDVIISNLTLNLRRFGWFFGQGSPMGFVLKRRSEWAGKPVQKGGGPSPGSIRNVVIRNLIVHAVGSMHVSGHPDSWLENVTLENIQIFLRTVPSAPFDWAVHAVTFRWAKDLKLKNIEIQWEKPELETWQSAMHLQDVEGLEIDSFKGRQAWPERAVPAIVFDNVKDAMVRNSTADRGTNVFLKVFGNSDEICLFGNDFRRARVPFQLGKGVKVSAVMPVNNIPASE
jgi:hypothetical protein